MWKQIGITLAMFGASIITMHPIIEKSHVIIDRLMQSFNIDIKTKSPKILLDAYRDNRTRELFTRMLQDGRSIDESTSYTTFDIKETKDCSLFSDFQSIMMAKMGDTNPTNVSMADWYYFDFVKNKATPLDLYMEDMIMFIHGELNMEIPNWALALIFLVLALLSTILIYECGISILESYLAAVNIGMLGFVVLKLVSGEVDQLTIIFKHAIHTALAAISMVASAVFGLLPTNSNANGQSRPIPMRYAMATVTYIAVLGFIAGVGVHTLFFPRYTTGFSRAVSDMNFLYEPFSSLHSGGGLCTPLWIDRNSEIDYAVYFKMRNDKNQCDNHVPNLAPNPVPNPVPQPPTAPTSTPMPGSDCEYCLKRVHDLEIQQKAFETTLTSMQGNLKGIRSYPKGGICEASLKCAPLDQNHWCNNNHAEEVGLGLAVSAADCHTKCEQFSYETVTNGCCQYFVGEGQYHNHCTFMPRGIETTWNDAAIYFSSHCDVVVQRQPSAGFESYNEAEATPDITCERYVEMATQQQECRLNALQVDMKKAIAKLTDLQLKSKEDVPQHADKYEIYIDRCNLF
jgi:hypothetical protein